MSRASVEEDCYKILGGARRREDREETPINNYNDRRPVPPPGSARGAAEIKAQSPPILISIEFSLEELYNGTKKKIDIECARSCGTCQGTGTKPNKKMRSCIVSSMHSLTLKAHDSVEVEDLCTAYGHWQLHSGLETFKCHMCNGIGQRIRPQDGCKKCRGKQVITKTKRVEFNLKKGTNPGEIIVLKDSGDQSTDFSLSGDLHIMIELSPHPTFTLQPSRNASSPADLSTTLSLTSAESRLGFSRVILTHLDGRGIKITHPAPGQIGSHPLSANDCIMIEGEGMRKDAMKGDLWIEIKVERFTSKLRGKALAALGYPLPPNRKDKPSRTVEVKFVQFDAGLHSAPEPVRFFLPSFFDQY